ncbi:glycosyl transferase family 1 [Aliiruegeria haliotis]|uniref:Glycosyl transferase family 1 n=1 Tax=Aliiruegeria haliotis TaxID=1280846 RepID=A0A2T0RP85_9RHOB|nr:glycosyltransferase [Aliiruegeria haliotis]PRY23004.1 glycosyl transferase family 1 [Aliiruegeria haliotis]
MRILFYNWVDYFDHQKRGGGVTQYQRNVLDHLDQCSGVSCFFLSSGTSYDLGGKAPRWAKVVHGPKDGRDRRFEIVNSECQAPSHMSFGDPAQVEGAATVEVFADFIARHGPFDVIHFNNLEGIPVDVLALKARLPQTRFVFALHNYYPFCPQVNFWHQERQHCSDFEGGARCAKCLPFKLNPRMGRLANAVNFTLHKGGLGPGTTFHTHAAGPAMGYGIKAVRKFAAARRAAATRQGEKFARSAAPQPAVDPLVAGAFRQRRSEFVAAINAHCDDVLCVSDRVRLIAETHGISPSLLHTSYIGSDHADRFAETNPRARILHEDGTAKMAFLGYMRRDKGFFFLLDALEAMPAHLLERLHVLFAAAGRDDDIARRFAALERRLASLTWVNGYSRDSMDEMLSDVDFGIIPVLWEDNLPQVAIEMHARHIPLLTSDRGGAQELGRFPNMVFRSEDAQSLHERIEAILGGEIDLNAYWAGAMRPVSMEQHVAELLAIYGRKTLPAT